MSSALRSFAPAALAVTVLGGCGGGSQVPPPAFSSPSLTLAVSGMPRQVTLSNDSALPIEQLRFTTEGLPGGTSVFHNCPVELKPRASCGLMVVPGSRPSAAPGDVAARPATVRAVSANLPTATLAVAVITHGSVHAGGYVFSIDDSTPITASVGGKVAGLSDLPGLHNWSPAEGAVAQSPRQYTGSSVTRPSALVPPQATPRRSSARATRASQPMAWQASARHILSTCRPASITPFGWGP